MTSAGIDPWTKSPEQSRRPWQQSAAAALALTVLALMVAMSAPAIAADGPARPKFDHFATGFPLLGAHSSVNCDSCHGRGAFKGTPTQCAGCHDGSTAVGKGRDHFPTNAPCETCHTERGASFEVVSGFDHAGITTGCNSCHQQDKPANHLPTPSNAECVLCHSTPPFSFDSAPAFNHTNVSGMRCDGCHSGNFANFGAIGKTTDHRSTPSGMDCNACHMTSSFSDLGVSGSAFDHTNITTGCNTCHLGDKPALHIPVPAGAECILCHQIPPETFARAANFNHNSVTSIRCDACHGGQFVAAGLIAKTPAHPPIQAGQDCNACHTSTAAFASVAFNHSGITTGCNSCHLTDKPATHIPVPAGAECVLCHRVSPDLFTTAALFNHNNVSTMRCDACHGGAFNGSGAIGKTPGHPVTQAGQDCNVCHTNTVSFAGAAFNHTGVTTGCNSCHLSDKPSNHLPVPAGSECVLCHRVPPDLFALAASFNHSKVGTMRCDTCHNGAYSSYGSIGKSSGHPATSAGQDCNACHTNTVSFAGATFNHAGVTTGCNSCHLSDKPSNHLPVPAGSECYLCHRVPPDSFTIAANYSHSKVTTMRCDSCHNGQYTGYGAEGKPGDHPSYTAGKDCNASGCHNTSNWD